ncbi:MAG: hypothetical protein QM493_02155 [Sulfurovum sp.]
MKRYIPIIVALFVTIGFAETIEIKSGDGYRSDLTSVQGTFKSRHQSRFPFVCYDRRVRIISDNGNEYLTYKGCTRVNVSCKSTGRAHFGKYPNDYKAHQALRRCRNAKPRFID